MRRRFLALGSALLLLAGCGAPGVQTAASDSTVKAAGLRASVVDVWVMPERGVTPLLESIRGAKKSIRLAIYLFTNHDTSAQIVQALLERAKAGVDVRVIMEANPYSPPRPNEPNAITAAQSNLETARTLIAGGVRVKRSSPKFRYTHEKAMVIDGTTALVMTSNFTNSAFTSNREYILVDQSPSDVEEIARIFDADWDEITYVPKDPDLVVSPNNSRSRIHGLIAGAKKSLLIEVEYLTDPALAQLLGDKVKAGVDVKIMLALQPKDETTGYDPNTDERNLLAQHGVTQVKFNGSPKMHAKAIIADEARAYVGSENLTANSLDNNREVGLLFNDAAPLATVLKSAKADWAR